MKLLMTIIFCCCLSGLAKTQDGYLLFEGVASKSAVSAAVAINYEEMAETYEEIDLFFTAACHWMEAKDFEQAYRCLFVAADKGFSNVEWLITEEVFKPLHGTLAWWELKRSVMANQSLGDMSLENTSATEDNN